MTVLLAGDIGGTKVDLQLVESTQEESTGKIKFHKLHCEHYLCRDFKSFDQLAKQFLSTAGKFHHPEKACFAVAGPVADNCCELTNLDWQLDGQTLQNELKIDKVTLINDFAAIGYGVSATSEFQTLQKGELQEGAPCAVIGAGTGLGEAFLIQQQDGSYQPYATEGSHADFAAQDQEEFDLREYISTKQKLPHVSVERVVSGPGIVTIYKFLRDCREITSNSEEIKKVVQKWEEANAEQRQKIQDPAPIITKAALERDPDSLCERTMQIFVKAYGAEAGNLALDILPFGGLYIAGGITLQILELIQRNDFMGAFIDKGRMKPLLEKIPVHIVNNKMIGVEGAAIYASRC